MNYVSEETIYDYTMSSNPQEKWRVELGADLFTNNGWISHISYEIGKKQQGADKYKDRKSTRLNSSHKPISYAVFCLKKKRNKKNKTERII